MKVLFNSDFYRQYKKTNVRIRNSVDECIRIFRKNPMDLQLNNHALRDEYLGYRSIDITVDWRAIFEEIQAGEDTVAYFITLGTHEQLFGNKRLNES